jgi:hypothetical protein
MRMSVIAIFVCGALQTGGFAQEKPNSHVDMTLDRCTKILKFGQLNEFFKPMKADAVMALGLLGDQRAVPLLLEHLQNEEDPNLQFQIVRSLGWLKSVKAVPPLEKLLKHKDRNLREVTVLALEEITGKDYGSKDRATQPLPHVEELLNLLDHGKAGANAPLGRGFGEVGKKYRFVFARPEIKDVSAELTEIQRDGWAKVRVQQGEATSETWINLATVTMIMPVVEKK